MKMLYADDMTLLSGSCRCTFCAEFGHKWDIYFHGKKSKILTLETNNPINCCLFLDSIPIGYIPVR